MCFILENLPIFLACDHADIASQSKQLIFTACDGQYMKQKNISHKKSSTVEILPLSQLVCTEPPTYLLLSPLMSWEHNIGSPLLITIDFHLLNSSMKPEIRTGRKACPNFLDFDIWVGFHQILRCRNQCQSKGAAVKV